jgi:antitoxin component YwqK of YwqJK toxin-antitoxin module
MEWLKHLAISHDGTCVLVNDWKVGTCYIKYRNNRLQYIKTYVNGRLNGPMIYYAKCGSVMYNTVWIDPITHKEIPR